MASIGSTGGFTGRSMAPTLPQRGVRHDPRARVWCTAGRDDATRCSPGAGPGETPVKTVVLDDDPTGTQAATGVQVLLECDADRLEAALREADSVYVQTNSRALDEASAVALVTRIREDALEAGRRLGVERAVRPAGRLHPARSRLRRDRRLRGCARTSSSSSPPSPRGAAPPSAGSTSSPPPTATSRRGRPSTPRDPVFGFRSSRLVDYVAEKSTRTGVEVPLDVVRDPQALAERFARCPGRLGPGAGRGGRRRRRGPGRRRPRVPGAGSSCAARHRWRRRSPGS